MGQDTDKVKAAASGAPPSDYPGLREAILARRADLPKRLAQVAAYALENPDEIAFGTASSIAASSSVQPSTLVRFAQTLGYQGFSELQSVFRERLRERIPSYEARLAVLRSNADPAAETAAIFAGFSETAERSVAQLRKSIDLAALHAAVETLARAETVYLIGQRRSFPITSYLAYALGKLGVRTVLIGSAAGIDAETVAFATPADAALAISFTPYASTTVQLAGVAAARGAPVVVITDSPFSPLVPSAAVVLEVVEADFAGFRSLGATLSLAMSLAVAIAERRAREAGLAAGGGARRSGR